MHRNRRKANATASRRRQRRGRERSVGIRPMAVAAGQSCMPRLPQQISNLTQAASSIRFTAVDVRHNRPIYPFCRPISQTTPHPSCIPCASALD